MQTKHIARIVFSNNQTIDAYIDNKNIIYIYDNVTNKYEKFNNLDEAISFYDIDKFNPIVKIEKNDKGLIVPNY